MHCPTGLLKGRKRTTRTHRRQYTPLSWIEARPLTSSPSVISICAPVFSALYIRMVVHASHGHIAVCPLVSITSVSGGHLIAIGRLIPLSMFVPAHRPRHGVTRRPRGTSSVKRSRTARCDRLLFMQCLLCTSIASPSTHDTTPPTYTFIHFRCTPFDTCVTIHRRELHLKDLWAMSDKQIQLMLKRVRLYVSCH